MGYFGFFGVRRMVSIENTNTMYSLADQIFLLSGFETVLLHTSLLLTITTIIPSVCQLDMVPSLHSHASHGPLPSHLLRSYPDSHLRHRRHHRNMVDLRVRIHSTFPLPKTNRSASQRSPSRGQEEERGREGVVSQEAGGGGC